MGTLLDRVRALPGVQAAGVGSVLPPDDDPVSVELFYEDDRGEASRREIVVSFGAVTRGYFAALGTRLRAGRRFDAADNLAEASSLILNETAARFFYPDRDPIGRLSPYGIDALDIAGGESPVIAVVDDMKYEGLAAPRGGTISVQWPRVPTGVSHRWCGPPAIRWRWPRRFATSSGACARRCPSRRCGRWPTTSPARSPSGGCAPCRRPASRPSRWPSPWSASSAPWPGRSSSGWAARLDPMVVLRTD